MLSKEIYKEVLSKANLNTQGIIFQGNFLFAYHGNTFILNKTSSTNAYDIDKVNYVPTSEITSSEISFTEENNRSDFTKIYEFAFPHTMTDVPEALQELRDYYFNNPSFTVVDNGITYRVIAKFSRPNKSREVFDTRNGKFIMIYQMQLSLTTYDSTKGYDANLAQLTIDGVSIPYTTFTKGAVPAHDQSNKVTDEENTSKKPYAQGVGGRFEVIYNQSAVLQKIFKACDGDVAKQSRTTTFTIYTNIDGIETTVTAYIWGTYSLAPNNVIILTCEWTEV